MGTPGLEKSFEKKISSGKFFSSSKKLATLRFWLILGEIPCVKNNQFKWKIEGSPTKSSSKKYFPTRFFSEKIIPLPGVPIAFISATLEHQRMSVELTAQLSFHKPPPLAVSDNRLHIFIF